MPDNLMKQLDAVIKFLQGCVERINQAVKKIVAFFRRVIISAHAKAGHPICPQCLHALVKFDGFSFFVQNPRLPIDEPGNAKKLSFTGLRCPNCEGIVHNGKFHPGTRAEQVILTHGTPGGGKSAIMREMMLDYMTSHHGAYVTLLSRKQYFAQHGADAVPHPISEEYTDCPREYILSELCEEREPEPDDPGIWAYRNFPDDFPWKDET